jgi:nucleoid-associated protein YgaU
VQISPDAARCSVCGEDLRRTIPGEYSARYFYRRAADLAARGDVKSALAEAERGIDFHESSELRLLAAILSKRIGDQERMRRHVAAIPADDRLRQEAEWLLRAQDARRQAERAAQGPAAQEKSRTRNPTPDRLPRTLNEVQVTSAASPQSAEAPWVQRLWGAVAMLLLLILGGMGWVLLSSGPDALLSLLPTVVQEDAASDQDVEDVATALPIVTPSITSTIPSDLVQPASPEPIANAAQGGVEGAGNPQVDLETALRDAGRVDLLVSDLSARLELTRLLISGVMPSDSQRVEVIDLARTIPGVGDVDAVNLLVRTPPTYTVRSGDSLWAIAFYFYGADPNKVAELYEANRDVLASPEALQVDMVLKLPPSGN